MDQHVKSDNEIIAEFMGLQVYQSYSDMQAVPIGDLKEWALPEQLQYDKEWDWLMPVVEKINELDDNGQLLGIDYDVLKSMQDWIVSVNINNAYGDLISIIKWYNAQPK